MKRLKLFIGLAFHTIFVIFLSAQTYLIIIIFLCVYFSPLFYHFSKIYSSVFLKFLQKTSENEGKKGEGEQKRKSFSSKVVADKFRRKTF